MDFANDEEIAELLNLSTTVIKEIQKSELKPPQTTGRPPVSQGNTRNLTDLWEKETASQNKTSAQSPQTTQVQSDGNEEEEIKSESIDGHISGTVNQLEQVPEQNQSRSSPGDDLDRALNKLEGRINSISSMDKEIKKGPSHPESPWVPSSNSTGDPPIGRGHPEHAGTDKTPDQATSRGNQSWQPGHRREYSFTTFHGTTRVISWCNPQCTPIRARPIYDECRCGECPTTCIMCRDDK
uniref:V protein n=1 Tax=avian paramyxovirus 8 TaxID=2560318 RepID=C5I0V3_9MONO|nr:V protein [Avian metaavulavirus 8]